MSSSCHAEKTEGLCPNSIGTIMIVPTLLLTDVKGFVTVSTTVISLPSASRDIDYDCKKPLTLIERKEEIAKYRRQNLLGKKGRW